MNRWRAFFEHCEPGERLYVSIHSTKYTGAFDTLGSSDDGDSVILVDHNGVQSWIPLDAITAVEVEW